MSANMARYPLLKTLHDYRFILIPALVFTIELTVWAVLNLKGVGDMGWVAMKNPDGTGSRSRCWRKFHRKRLSD